MKNERYGGKNQIAVYLDDIQFDKIKKMCLTTGESFGSCVRRLALTELEKESGKSGKTK